MGHLVAGELGFTLEKLEIEVSGNLNPDRLFGTSFSERAGFKQIEIKLKPYSNADSELLKRWTEEVENRCPVNDNLREKTPILITVMDS